MAGCSSRGAEYQWSCSEPPNAFSFCRTSRFAPTGERGFTVTSFLVPNDVSRLRALGWLLRPGSGSTFRFAVASLSVRSRSTRRSEVCGLVFDTVADRTVVLLREQLIPGQLAVPTFGMSATFSAPPASRAWKSRERLSGAEPQPARLVQMIERKTAASLPAMTGTLNSFSTIRRPSRPRRNRRSGSRCSSTSAEYQSSRPRAARPGVPISRIS